MKERINTVIIGGGHAGLTLSMILQERDVPHVIFEKNARPFEVWRSERWDEFLMNTPHSLNRLYGQADDLPDVAGLPVASCLAAWDAHLEQAQPPLRLRHTVTCVATADDSGDLVVEWQAADGSSGVTCARNVVAATGFMQVPKIPACARRLPPAILQLNSTNFKRTTQLHPGAVLIVGAGKTGVQVADLLLRAGKEVYLSTSRVRCGPLTFRGKSLAYALIDTGLLTQTKEQVPEAVVHTRSEAMGGADRPIGYHSLARLGARLLGRLEDISADGRKIFLRDDLAENIQYAQDSYEQILANLTELAEGNPAFEGCPPLEREAELEPYAPLLAYADHAPLELDLETAGITSVIWATGFTGSFPWLAIDSVRKAYAGYPLPTNCATPHPGFFWLGFPFARTRLSFFLIGHNEDALWISSQLRP